ncbi:glycosyltransferase family 39 protein [Kallotenue papyrolyticum]|uniref:glycosyltransferase family 39 protein n=1 Tax=Kallotenue papyrolyticum TaxID=1325125 RepID=UPI0004785EEA|nr:glycosyltransferase family 39 protein [Kallotenue papyrolyticum]
MSLTSRLARRAPAGAIRPAIRAGHRAWWQTLGGLLLLGWGLLISAAHDFGLADEIWFLRVAQRVAAGERLYGDVFFGATPLSIYLSAPLVRLLGVELLVIKALVAACFAASVLLGLRIARQMGVSPAGCALVLLGLLAYAWPRQAGGYTPLAAAGLLATWSATLAWRDAAAHHARYWLIAIGVLAGLTFAAKQNIGLYALAAALTAVALGGAQPWRVGRRTLTALLTVTAAFSLTCLLSILPVLLEGAWSQFVDYGFVNKRTYLRLGPIGYVDELKRLPQRVQRARSLAQAAQLYPHSVLLLIPLALTGLLLALALVRRRRWVLATALLFVAAALAGAYPRFDIEHTAYVAPAALIALVGSAARLSVRRVRYALGLLAALWFGAGSLLINLSALQRMSSPDYEPARLPHLRGILVSRHEQATLAQRAQQLRGALRQERTLLLTPYAAFYYLVSDLPNPTPFDYPLATAFGLHGEQATIAAIQRGEIGSVCLQQPWRSRLRPPELAQYVEHHLVRQHALGACVLYRRRAAVPDGRAAPTGIDE